MTVRNKSLRQRFEEMKRHPVFGDHGFDKKIYSLWHDGEANAPALVRLCLKRWRELNPEYEVIVYDRAMALSETSDLVTDAASLSPQSLSDVLRMRLLSRYSGIWVDATLLPVTPLRSWLFDQIGDTSLFLFSSPGMDRLISSWFIVAPRGSYLIRRWAEEAFRYWDRPHGGSVSLLGMPEDPVAAIRNNKSDLSLEKGYYYYWLHYLFADILDSDPTFSSEWGDCLPLPATPAHALQELCFQQAEVSSSEIRTAADSAPVQKLNWRKNYPLEMLEAL